MINDSKMTAIDLSARSDTVFSLQPTGGSIPLVKLDSSLNLRGWIYIAYKFIISDD